MTFLTLEGIGKRYGDFTAIEHIDLAVERGEFLSLLGPSGCGKTTTLQMIAGFVTPTQGRVLLDGRDITRTPPEKRGMGIVFQSYALFPHMTVAENIGFGLDMQGVRGQARSARIGESLEQVRLNGLGARYPKQLSGGQRQRVAIARALAIRPAVLLLDEPMSNLDAKLREDMHVELRDIQRALGITTVLVTHDQVEAMTMSDRIAVMHRGRVAQLSTPQQAYEQPRTPFASTFLGKTNALPGRVVTRGAHDCAVDVAGATLTVPHAGHLMQGPVTVYIRPEKLSLAPLASARVQARVRHRLFLGNLWLLQVDSALGALQLSVPNRGATPPGEGETVGLAWADEDMRVLEEEASHGPA